MCLYVYLEFINWRIHLILSLLTTVIMSNSLLIVGYIQLLLHFRLENTVGSYIFFEFREV